MEKQAESERIKPLKADSAEEVIVIQDFLQRFGYSGPGEHPEPGVMCETTREWLGRYRRFNGLATDDHGFDDEVGLLMANRYCELPDLELRYEPGGRMRLIQSRSTIMTQCSWHGVKRILSYRFERAAVPFQTARAAAAVALWAEVIPLDIVETAQRDSADVEVSFPTLAPGVRGRATTLACPSDGFTPPAATTTQFMELDPEQVRDVPRFGLLQVFESVFAHEFGHILGLGHRPGGDDDGVLNVMDPNFVSGAARLSAWDKFDIRFRHGFASKYPLDVQVRGRASVPFNINVALRGRDADFVGLRAGLNGSIQQFAVGVRGLPTNHLLAQVLRTDGTLTGFERVSTFKDADLASIHRFRFKVEDLPFTSVAYRALMPNGEATMFRRDGQWCPAEPGPTGPHIAGLSVQLEDIPAPVFEFEEPESIVFELEPWTYQVVEEDGS